MKKQVEKIRKEIERIMAEEMSLFEEACKDDGADTSASPVVYTRMQTLLSFIDSLQEEPAFDDFIQEGDKVTVNEDGSRFNRSQLERVIASQEEPVSEDLEEAAREAATWHSRNGGERFFPNDYQKFIAGANWMKQQMMKDAVSAQISDFGYDTEDGDSCGCQIEFSGTQLEDLHSGDKVKLIIIKG